RSVRAVLDLERYEELQLQILRVREGDQPRGRSCHLAQHLGRQLGGVLMPADGRPVERPRRGFMFGELLIALLLLAVAVSSLAALMYSVSRRPTTTRAETECVVSDAARGKCVPATAPQNPETKLLRSGCATRSV